MNILLCSANRESDKMKSIENYTHHVFELSFSQGPSLQLSDFLYLRYVIG